MLTSRHFRRTTAHQTFIIKYRNKHYALLLFFLSRKGINCNHLQTKESDSCKSQHTCNHYLCLFSTLYVACAHEMSTSEFSSPFLISISVAYAPPFPNTLKLFKCDVDHSFCTTYHQNLNPQQVFGEASFNA